MTVARGHLVALGTLLLLASAACDSDEGTRVASGGPASTAAPSVTTAPLTAAPSKVPDSISSLVGEVSLARAGGAPDVSKLSNAFLRVRADAKIEVVVRSTAALTQDQVAELRDLGAEIEGSMTDAAVQAWIPYDQVQSVASLPWVVTISAPSYARVGG